MSEQVRDRESIDLASQKHGPLFLALKPEEQMWVIKLHKNLGHPGTLKLQTFCKQLGKDPKLIQAIVDLRCSSCQECKSPTIPRPSAIHEERDFGDMISMDGITWTNKHGKMFNSYHFVDHSATFQTAICSPQRTTESVIKAITVGWIAWAGAPGTLCLDAADEFSAMELSDFLQKRNIRLRMIAPEAHWQNSRAERHGGYSKTC